MDESKKIPVAILWAVGLIVVLTIPTGPPLTNILAAFFPMIITLIAGIGLTKSKTPIPQYSAIAIPLGLSVFLGLLSSAGAVPVFGQLSAWYLAVANMVGGIGIMAILTDFFMATPWESTPDHVNHHIEEVLRYAYAINESIRRVYSHENGATQVMRNKLLLSVEKAQDLQSTFAKENYKEAHNIVFQLYEQVRDLFNTEHEVFGRHKLSNLSRDAHGKSRIIDVLIANDPEPVRSYVENISLSLQHLNEELLTMPEN